jgi:hypothetical protein
MSKLKSSYSTISLRDNLSNLYKDLDKNTLYSTILSLQLNTVLEMQKNEIHSSIFSNEKEEDAGFINRLSIVENLVKELEMYNFVPSVKKFIQENKEIFEENKLEIAVEKTLHFIKNNKNSKFYETAISKLEESVKGEDPISSILENMKEHNWIPEIKRLYEFCKTLRGSMTSQNPNFKVSKIYSPVEPINESEYLFYSSGKLLSYNGSEINESNSSISEDFKSLVYIMESSNITQNGIRFRFNNSILDVKLGEKKEILVNNKLVESKNLSNYLLNSSLASYGDKNKIALFERAYTQGSDIKEIDLGYKVSSNIYEGLSCSIFTIKNKIFIQKINESMKENVIVIAESANDAISIVKNFMNFDISESVKFIAESEKIKSDEIKIESQKIKNKINFLMEKLSEVDSLELEIGKSDKLTEAKNIIKNEIYVQNSKLRVLEGVETSFEPNPSASAQPSMVKLSTVEDLVAGKEYTIDGQGGYMFQGFSDGSYIFNQKDETNPTPIHMNRNEIEASIASGKITK